MKQFLFITIYFFAANFTFSQTTKVEFDESEVGEIKGERPQRESLEDFLTRTGLKEEADGIRNDTKDEEKDDIINSFEDRERPWDSSDLDSDDIRARISQIKSKEYRDYADAEFQKYLQKRNEEFQKNIKAKINSQKPIITEMVNRELVKQLKKQTGKGILLLYNLKDKYKLLPIVKYNVGSMYIDILLLESGNPEASQDRRKFAKAEIERKIEEFYNEEILNLDNYIDKPRIDILSPLITHREELMLENLFINKDYSGFRKKFDELFEVKTTKKTSVQKNYTPTGAPPQGAVSPGMKRKN